MSRYGWVGDYVDPNTFLDMWLTGGGNNNTGWSDARYDALIAAAQDVEAFVASGSPEIVRWRDPERVAAAEGRLERAMDPGARRAALGALRMEILREAEAILLHEGLPIVPIYFYVNSGLLAPEVQGVYFETRKPDGSRGVNLQSWHPLRGVWIDDAARRERLGR